MAFASFDRQSSAPPVSEINMVPLDRRMLVLQDLHNPPRRC